MAAVIDLEDVSEDNSSAKGLTGAGDPEIDTTHIKKQMSRCLDEINGSSTGTFATAGPLLNAPSPGLSVSELGAVGLPLSSRDAVELTKICHQAPFGKGSKTIIDTNVRNTWELNPDHFQLRNPAWQVYLDQALQQVANALGIVGGMMSMRAELYKLLLYDEGAFFESHTDTEKAPGMFGTLVIALPSEHTGGEVEAKFGGQTKALQTADSSAFGYSYLAWYSDVEHTVRPVTSGHRLVLTYNLLHVVAGAPQFASHLSNDKAKLNKLLALWNYGCQNHNADSPKLLAYMLAHKYTDVNLRMDHLKGTDALKARYLKAACEAQDFCFFLANLEHTKDGSCEETYDPYDHYGGYGGGWGNEDDSDSDDEGNSVSGPGDWHALEEVFDTSLYLRTFYRSDGEQLATKVSIEEADIVQEDPFDRDPDKEEYEGYTGNAGASATHIYRNSCIIILPRDYQVDFLLREAKKGNVDMEAWIGKGIEEVRTTPENKRRRAELTRTCELIIKASQTTRDEEKGGKLSHSWNKPPGFSDTALGIVARAAMLLRCPPLFESAATVAKDMLPIDIYRTFGELLGDVNLAQWQQGLELALGRIQRVHQRWGAFTQTLQAGGVYQNEIPSLQSSILALESLMRQTIESTLSADMTVYKEDAQALIEMTRQYGKSFLFQRILPFVKKHVSSSTFSVKFLVLLFNAEQEGIVQSGVAKNIYRDVLADLMPVFKLEMTPSSAKGPRYPYLHYDPRESEKTDLCLMSGDDIASLVDHCRSMGLLEEMEAIMGKLVVASKSIDVVGFGSLLKPLLTRLVELSTLNNTPLTNNAYRFFFQNILDTYVQRYVGLEPAKPRDWAQARKGCGCMDCRRLDTFLTNPRERVGRFALDQKRRGHIHGRLDGTGCTHETERQGSPYTLVVTKTQKEWRESYKAWQERCLVATQSLQNIGIQSLQEILGESYRGLIDLNTVKLGLVASGRSEPATDISTGVPARSAPMGAWHAAKAEEARKRTPLGTVSRPNSSLNQTAAVTGQCVKPGANVDIIDLT